MTKLGWCIGVGLLLGCATASPPPQAAQSTSTPQALQQDGTKTAEAKKDPKKDLICETYKVTGSHIRKTICRTKEQMKQDREQAQKLIHDGDLIKPAEGT